MVQNKKTKTKNIPKLTPILAASVMVVSSILVPQSARGLTLNEQIQQKQAEQDKARAEASRLGAQASGVQAQINDLQAQIASIQAQIDSLTARQNELTAQIETAQKKLEEQKSLLSANLRSMYIEGDISPLEMIASSKNLGDFVDKQEYRDRIKENISGTMDEISRLKKQLDDQKREVTQNLDTQKSLRGALDQKNAEAGAQLSSINQDKAGFDAQVKQRASELAALRAQQRTANASGPYFVRMLTVYPDGVSGGGYPSRWASAPLDAYVDDWGMFSRECVSYTAFKVSQRRTMPYWGGRGNAKEWPDNALRAGIDVEYGGGARRGDVAISKSGSYGHAMYVEEVYSDGTAKVSQYNWYVRGEYSEMIISQNNLFFIHF